MTSLVAPNTSGEPTSPPAPHSNSNHPTGILKTAFINFVGQSSQTLAKITALGDFCQTKKIDVLGLSEANFDEVYINRCDFLSSNYQYIFNNASNGYGTAILVSNELTVTNIERDTQGRFTCVDLNGLVTFWVSYLPSGNSIAARQSRDEYLTLTIPRILRNRNADCIGGGDLNCLAHDSEGSNPNGKVSKHLRKLIDHFGWEDCFHSASKTISTGTRYYNAGGMEHYARLDRCLMGGKLLSVIDSEHSAYAHSDHLAIISHFNWSGQGSPCPIPWAKPPPRLRRQVILDKLFQERVAIAALKWEKLRGDLDPQLLWEESYKKGILKIGLTRAFELRQEKRGEYNALCLMQDRAYSCLAKGIPGYREILAKVNARVKKWYEEREEEKNLLNKQFDLEHGESQRLYHHDLVKKHEKKRRILRLDTPDGPIQGHQEVAKYLEKTVEELFLSPLSEDVTAEQALLNEVQPCFTEADNQMLESTPSPEEVRRVLRKANLNAAPGTDGLPALVYAVCWDAIKGGLMDTITDTYLKRIPSPTQRKSVMVFGSKPKYPNSCNPEHKRRISLLNADFKILSGIAATRLQRVAAKILSPLQLVAGHNRRIHHGIARARDAITSVKVGQGGGLVDLDFKAGFDWLVMSWVFKVLKAKNCSKAVIDGLAKLYSDRSSLINVNGICGKEIPNIRGTLSQGDIPSMTFFAIGIDPLLKLIERRLSGMVVFSLPVAGPMPEERGGCSRMKGRKRTLLPPLEERFKGMAYADDVKTVVTCLAELSMVIDSCGLMERASGVKLHRDPRSGKCRILLLGSWKDTVSQADIPAFIIVSQHLDFVGVTLCDTTAKTIRANGGAITNKVKGKMAEWKGGRHMPITSRGLACNTWASSRVWFRCATIPLSKGSVAEINKDLRSWILADCLQKPTTTTLCRSRVKGGLGMQSVGMRGLATRIRTLCELAMDSSFEQSLLLNTIYRREIYGEFAGGLNTPSNPYYGKDVWDILRELRPAQGRAPTIKAIVQSMEAMHTSETEGDPTALRSWGENIHPGNDWEETWRRASIREIPGELVDFGYRLLHHLLPTRDRLLGMKLSPDDGCKGCVGNVETISHILFTCPGKPVSGGEMTALANAVSGGSTEKMALLQFEGGPHPDLEKAYTIAVLAACKYRYDMRYSRAQEKVSPVVGELLVQLARLSVSDKATNIFACLSGLIEEVKMTTL